MAPPLLALRGVSLGFGGRPLIEDASLAVEAGARLALVGRNGSGKSNLLRIAAGLVEADGGERFVQPGATLRYLPQEPDLSGHATTGDYVMSGLGPSDDRHEAQRLLWDLGLTGEEATGALSGGEARRAALARVLAPRPDILLLDEPTNHLDLPAIEWLEGHLREARSALVLVSHDRRMLQTLSRATLWLDRGRSVQLDFGFERFEDWRDAHLEEQADAAHKLGRRIEREEHWITHGVSGRRRRNMRRVHELTALRQEESRSRGAAGGVVFAAAEAEASGRLVAELDGVSKSFGGRPVVQDLSTVIRRGERIGLVGPNGAGKTTLIRLLLGELAPDTGRIRLGVRLESLVIDQRREALRPDWTLAEALTDGSGDQVVIGTQARHVQSVMKDYLFAPEQAGTPVRSLSGGERARLMLARALRQPANLLVLDEPTNDLDLETLDLLQDLLAEHSGTIVLISHDRDFIDRVCTSVIASQGDGRWVRYAGGYSDMVAQRGTGVAARRTAGQAGPKTAASPAASSAAPVRREKLSFKQRYALDTLPGEIEAHEVEAARLRREMTDPALYSRDKSRFDTVTSRLSALESQIAEKEQRWLELEELREQLES